MSGIGTIIAAGVAPTTQQASQAANRRDKRLHEQQRAAQRTREVFETHLETLEENDETETNARLRADAQLHTAAHSPNPPGAELAKVHRRPARDAHPGYDRTGHQLPADRDHDGWPHIDVQG